MNTPKTGHPSGKPGEPGRAPAKPETPKDQYIDRILKLSIREEIDRGNDPYNNTGQQVILKLRQDSRS